MQQKLLKWSCETWLSFSKIFATKQKKGVSKHVKAVNGFRGTDAWFQINLSLGDFHANRPPISSKKLERIRELEALGKKEQTWVRFCWMKGWLMAISDLFLGKNTAGDGSRTYT